MKRKHPHQSSPGHTLGTQKGKWQRIQELQQGALAVGSKSFSIYRQCFRPDLKPTTIQHLPDDLLSHLLGYVGLVPSLLLVNHMWTRVVLKTGGWMTRIPKELCSYDNRDHLQFLLRYGGKRITRLEWPFHLDFHFGGGSSFVDVCLDKEFFRKVPNLRHISHVGGLPWGCLSMLRKFAEHYHFTCSIWEWENRYHSFETNLSMGKIAGFMQNYEKQFDFSPLFERLVLKHKQRFFQSEYLFESIARHFPQSYKQRLVPLECYPKAILPGDMFALVRI